jgi:hypothetical protein
VQQDFSVGQHTIHIEKNQPDAGSRRVQRLVRHD